MRKQCLCGKFVFLAFKAVSLDFAAPLMTFFQAEIKIVIIYSELILIFAPFMIFQSILDVFFHTIKTMYSGQAPKRTKHIMKVVLSYRLLISINVKTHLTRFVVSDAILSLNM